MNSIHFGKNLKIIAFLLIAGCTSTTDGGGDEENGDTTSTVAGNTSHTDTTTTAGTHSTHTGTDTSPDNAVCGNGVCESGESSDNCSEDCSVECSHNECDGGDPLDESCGTCVSTVCYYDSYCCDTEWDDQCVSEAEYYCGITCDDGGGGSGGSGGGGGSDDPCPHFKCDMGEALDPSCNSCVATVCETDSYCCDTAWDQECVDLVGSLCGYDCGGGDGGSGGSGGGDGEDLCPHFKCVTGEALSPSCNSCVSDICTVDSYCCDTEWDDACVEQVATVCGYDCGGGDGGSGGSGGGGSTCAHDECDAGSALDDTCNSCVSSVCAYDVYCCDTEWDEQCIYEAEYFCGLDCGDDQTDTCAHDECDAGEALDSTCSTCSDYVCYYDSYCCDTEWDSTCISEAESWCALDCGSSLTCDNSGDCDSDSGCITCALEGNCSDEYDACVYSDDCLNFWDCYYYCEDEWCVEDCAYYYPEGYDLYSSMVECAVCEECYNDCDGAEMCGG